MNLQQPPRIEERWITLRQNERQQQEDEIFPPMNYVCPFLFLGSHLFKARLQSLLNKQLFHLLSCIHVANGVNATLLNLLRYSLF